MQLFESRAHQIFARFVAFHLEHPYVWLHFKRMTMDRLQRGFKHYGASGVIERVRWETATPATGSDGLKINNDFKAWYARMWGACFPEHADFYRSRKLLSEDRLAAARDVAVHDGSFEPAPVPDHGYQLPDALGMRDELLRELAQRAEGRAG